MEHTTPAGLNSQDIERLQALNEEPAGPSEYWEVSVIIAGALDQTEEFTDREDVEEFLTNLRACALAEDFTAEVYVQYHGHAPTVSECACAQYETDHKPDHIFNLNTGEE